MNHQQPDRAEIIWAFPPKGKYAHAYPGRKALASGVPLCGRNTRPTLVLENIDANYPGAGELFCPQCRKLLVFAKFMNPVAERKPAETRNRS